MVEKRENEFYDVMEKLKQMDSLQTVKIIEMSQDIFSLPTTYSLTHCVVEDLRMNTGKARNKIKKTRYRK